MPGAVAGRAGTASCSSFGPFPGDRVRIDSDEPSAVTGRVALPAGHLDSDAENVEDAAAKRRIIGVEGAAGRLR